jgi:uncharacterized protein
MQTTLAATALLMGLAGGPHCLAMCGAACAGIGRSRQGGATPSLWMFQVGRVAGYSSLGAVAAASLQGIGWLATQSAALRPFWTMFHVAAALLGLMLLWQARQPAWLERGARALWTRAKSSGVRRGNGAPLVLGVLWALLPCGLLYSALLVAALSANAAEGALMMALFALGSGLSLMAGPWLWLRLRFSMAGSNRWAIRLSGLALASSSGWSLWASLVHNTAPWCLPL